MLFKKKKFHVLWVVFFLMTSYLRGNDPYFKNFTALDGLSSSEVYDITQDNMGYLWFATDRGLTRYDGITFKRYTTSDGLLDNVVYNFFEMKDGTIWCSTSNHELFFFRNAEEGFQPYPYNDIIAEVMKNRALTINNLVISKKNALFLSFNDRYGYLKINVDGSVQNMVYKIMGSDTKKKVWKILDEAPNFMFKDSLNTPDKGDVAFRNNYEIAGNASFSRVINFQKHKIKAGFMNGHCFFIDVENNIKEYPLSVFKKATPIISGKYNEDLFWIGFQYGGVMLIDTKGNVKAHFLKEYSVSKIYTDHEGGMWVSTLNQGVFYCRQPLINFHRLESYPTELAQTNEKELLVGLHNGVVLKENLGKNTFSTLHVSQNKLPAFVAHNKITDVSHYGEINSLTNFKEGTANINGFSDDDFPLKYGPNAITVGADEKLVKLNLPSKVFDFTKKGSEYVIGTNTGLYSYAKDKSKVSYINNEFLSNRIFDIDYKFNVLYAGTMGNGIVIQKNDTLFSINKDEGLLSDICTEVFPEDKYSIWAGTNQGLNHIVLYANNTYDIEQISILEGLPCSEITDIEIIGNTVWVASKEGLFSFPKQLLKEIKKEHKKWLHIGEIKVNAKIEEVPFKKILSYNENNIDLNFSAISFRDGRNREFRYKLNQTDSLWNYTKTNVVQLSNLSPGAYKFTLQTKTENGGWTPSLIQSFAITVPFWKSWWFQSLLVVVVSVILFLMIRYQQEIFRKNPLNEITVLLTQKLRKTEDTPIHVEIKANGRIIKLPTNEIGYFKSARNYIEIYTASQKYLVRGKLSNFYDNLPDKSAYTRLHQSYIVRIDQVTQKKGIREVSVWDASIPVSKTYVENLNKLFLA